MTLHWLQENTTHINRNDNLMDRLSTLKNMKFKY